MSIEKHSLTEIRSDEFYGKIYLNDDPDDIGNRLQENKSISLRSNISSYKVDKLKSLLKKIHQQANRNTDYSPKHRILHFLLHEELSKRGVAPVWRDIPKFVLPKKNSPQARYAADLQIFDLFWVYSIYSGLKTPDGEWGGIFEDIFTSSKFNYQKAYQISRSELTNAKKVIQLSLNDAIQEDLSVVRSQKISKRISRIKKEGTKVQMSLHEASIRFPKRKRTTTQIELCKNVWIASELSNNSHVEAIRKYSQITGDSINPSTYRSKLKATKDTLHAVKYSKSA